MVGPVGPSPVMMLANSAGHSVMMMTPARCRRLFAADLGLARALLQRLRRWPAAGGSSDDLASRAGVFRSAAAFVNVVARFYRRPDPRVPAPRFERSVGVCVDAQPRVSKLPSPAHASGVAPVRAPCPRPSSTPRARGCAQRRLTAHPARHHPPRPTGHGTGQPSRRRFPRPGRHRTTEARPPAHGQDPRGSQPRGPFPDAPVQRHCR